MIYTWGYSKRRPEDLRIREFPEQLLLESLHTKTTRKLNDNSTIRGA